MKTAFGSPDKVDLWTGGLAEQHARGSLLGPTFTTIIADQFERLRDGDPFYFENALDRADVRMVKNTTLSDIITRNTDATNMQADVFMNGGLSTDAGQFLQRICSIMILRLLLDLL